MKRPRHGSAHSSGVEPEPLSPPRFEVITSSAQHQEIWFRLVEKIRSGQPDAAAAFHATYERGIRLLFRRHLGSIGLDSLVAEALAGAVEEIRHGWLTDPRDLVLFVRTVVARHRAGRPPESGRGVSEKARLRQEAAFLQQALRHFTARERAALERYYLNGDPIEVVLRSSSLTVAEFDSLKARLFDVARQKPYRQVALHPPKVRRAGAAS